MRYANIIEHIFFFSQNLEYWLLKSFDKKFEFIKVAGKGTRIYS